MRIAYLGWGSLIWRPGCLAIETKDDEGQRWYEDGPYLPIEFARQSSDNRITLVIIPKIHCPTQPVMPVLWAYSSHTNIETARENLMCREGSTNDRNIGVWPSKQDDSYECADLIGNWAQSKNLDGVVWTALKPKFEQVYQTPSSIEVLEYLKKLCSEKQERAARQYVCKTHPQIRTPYRTNIEQAFGWTYDDSME